MKTLVLVYLFMVSVGAAFAQALPNDDCTNAIPISNPSTYCSEPRQYSNSTATGTDNDIWFKFTATNFEVRITITSSGIRSPEINLFAGCGTGIAGNITRDGNTTIFNKEGLIPGMTYLFSIGSSTNNRGAFQLCLENYQSTIKPGQDFPGATLICSATTVIHEINVTGAGLNPDEAAGTCLDVLPNQNSETNSAWYRWTAASDGTLVFTIKPNQRNDMDWVLYELGPEGNIKSPSASNAIRCAAGHGLGSPDCPQSASEPEYTLTGLDFNETDTVEASCSGQGQNGMLKAVTMKEGYVYALLVNNFTEGNNAFELSFTDRSGKAGTGLFKGPTGRINRSVQNACTPQQSFTFTTDATGYDSITWYFGEGASIIQSSSDDPVTVTYQTLGIKTVVLELKSDLGCTVVETETFEVGLIPDPPVISVNKAIYCLTDTIRLTTQAQSGVRYQWTGPNNFSSDLQSPEIPLVSTAAAGTYTLVVSRGDCVSPAVTIVVPPIQNNPVAAFTADPALPNKLAYPVTVRFQNRSSNADAFFWDFGDGSTSTDEHPQHTFIMAGNYSITLTAFKTGVCQASVVMGTYLVSAPGTVFIPNTFTPNNDARNDELVVNMNNIRSYKIVIYNRYGVPVYKSNDITTNWDGRYKNEPVPVGTYYYVIEAIDLDNNAIRKSGSVTILR